MDILDKFVQIKKTQSIVFDILITPTLLPTAPLQGANLWHRKLQPGFTLHVTMRPLHSVPPEVQNFFYTSLLSRGQDSNLRDSRL